MSTSGKEASCAVCRARGTSCPNDITRIMSNGDQYFKIWYLSADQFELVGRARELEQEQVHEFD